MSHSDYYQLQPETVLQAVESCGYLLDGTLLALNSYENRVYRVATDAGERLVVKFYRPGRWSDAQIQEEHDFSHELQQAEVPVIAPLNYLDDQSLLQWQGFRFAVFPCVGGRTPELEDLNLLEQMGRFLGRFHACSAQKNFQYRPHLDLQSYGIDSVATIMEANFMAPELKYSYQVLAEQLVEQLKIKFESYSSDWDIRLHADFHPGNMLWMEHGPAILDLDDARMGPAVQDLWMLVGEDPSQQLSRLDALLSGYRDFMTFNKAQLAFIEPLRTLRMLHYSAWLCRRWEDPSFQFHFPWFAEPRYWEQQILQMKEQLAMLLDDQTFQRLEVV